MLAIVHHPDYTVPLRPGRRIALSKYGHLREALERRGLLVPGRYLAPGPAAIGQIGLAHEAGFVDRVFSLSLGARETRRIGLPLNAVVLRRVRLSSAGTTLAAWLALENGIACNSAGGAHHAASGHGAGFCIFNDVAVAIRNLQHQGAIRRALVIDADVHQGDGTAEIFAGDAAVRTVSIHAEKNFPARKQRSDIDVGLPDGTGDATYLEALAAVLARAFGAISPDVVFFNAGVDVHDEDRLGRLALSDAGIRARDRMVLGAARARSLPVVGVLGGGYCDDPVALAGRHAILFEEAARLADAG